MDPSGLSQDDEARIRLRAHAIWEAEGRPDGRHDDHWRQAREEVAGSETQPGRIDPDRAADAAPGPATAGEDARLRQEQLLDEALEETFPGSDPISPKQIT